MKFTERSLRILHQAEKQASRTNTIMYPIHLLFGILHEKTGVCAEIHNTCPDLIVKVREQLKNPSVRENEQGIPFEHFQVNISHSTKNIFEFASNRMNRFKQIYINEGHLFEGILESNDQLTSAIFEAFDIASILEIVAYPRNLTVSLKEYSFPHPPSSKITYRKATRKDVALLKRFVNMEFGNGWMEAIENGLFMNEIPIFIAFDNTSIIGFACFDVVGRKKGLFGPMGVALSNRAQGIGYTLLHLCLNEMKEMGYESIIIDETGPIEFYERANLV